MAELKIGVSTDLSPMADFARRMVEGGVAVEDLGSAFKNLGVPVGQANAAIAEFTATSKAAVEATAGLGAATKVLGQETATTTARVDSMSRAFAYSAARLAANETGVGQLGFAFARVGSISSTLAPILSAAFPVVAAVAMIEVVSGLIEKYETWSKLGVETTRKMDDLSLSIGTQTDKIELQNVKLQNQISILEGLPTDKLAEEALAAQIAFQELGKAVADDLEKINRILLAGHGAWSELFADKANLNAVEKLLEPIQRQYELAVLGNNKEAAQKALLQEEIILQQQLAEEEKKRVAFRMGPRGIVSRVPGSRDPDQEAIAALKAGIDAVNSLKERGYALDEQGNLKITKDKLTAQKELDAFAARTDAEEARRSEAQWRKEQSQIKELEALGLSANDALLFAERHTSEETDAAIQREREERKALRGDLELEFEDQQIALEGQRKAQELLTRQMVAEEKAIRDLAKADRDKATEDLRVIRDLASRKLVTQAQELAGLKRIGDEMEKQHLTAVAQIEVEIAAERAKQFAGQFGAPDSDKYLASQERIRGLQDKINELNIQNKKDLEGVQNQVNALDTSWKNFWQRQHAEVLSFSVAFRTQMQTTITQVNAGMANAVNQWIAHNKSFAASMRDLGVQILEGFVSTFIQIGLKWLETKIFMRGVEEATNTAPENVIRQAAVAGAGGTASMAAAPFPLDLGAAAFGASMFAASMAYLPLAVAQKGGIVPNDMTVMAHAREMILPAHISEAVQRSASGGTMGAPGHTINVHYIHNGPAGDMDTLKAHSMHIARIVRDEMRRLNMG